MLFQQIYELEVEIDITDWTENIAYVKRVIKM